jgi:AraC-like DNA-binding protein
MSGAGYAVGYQSPSQFSREYTRLYAKSPLRDLDGGRLAQTAEASSEKTG